MITVTRTQRWLVFGLILIVLPAGLLAYMSWQFLSQLEDNLYENGQREIIHRANRLQDYERLLLERAQKFLEGHVSGASNIVAYSDVNTLFTNYIVCDKDFNPFEVPTRPEWERNPGRELDALAVLPLESPQILGALRSFGYLKSHDQEVSRRLLLARSLQARGLLSEAHQEFLSLAKRFPITDEAVMSVIAALELAIQASPENNQENLEQKESLEQLEILMMGHERSSVVKRFVSRHLSAVIFGNQRDEGLRNKIMSWIEKSRSEGPSKQQQILEDLNKHKYQLIQAKNENKVFFRTGEKIWIFSNLTHDNKRTIGVLDISKWFNFLQKNWDQQKEIFSLDINFLSQISNVNSGTGQYQVRLFFPGTEAQVRVSSQDEMTELFAQQARLGTWGTGLLIMLLTLGTTMALSAVIQAQKVSRLKSDFVSTVSHELRTPLTSIQMFVDTLKSGRILSDTERNESYDIIAKESRRLTSLIERLLAFSALEKGHTRLKREPVALERVCAHCVSLVKPQFDEAGVELVAEIPTEEVEIEGDGNILVEIVVNLLSNALKYAFEGRMVELQLQNRDKDCVISVKDRGPGIPHDKRSALFEAFVRGEDQSVHQNVPGAGLGLALVHSWVNWHEGTINVLDREGGGAIFEITLPKPS